jgi:hypothetical protein
MPTYFIPNLQPESLDELHSQPGRNEQPGIRHMVMERPSGMKASFIIHHSLRIESFRPGTGWDPEG